MGASKTTYYPDKLNEMATIAKSLGHPARITIIEYLLESGERNCNDIANVLPLSQSTASQHIQELKKAGLIFGEIIRNEIYYSVNHARIAMLKKYLTALD